VKLRFDDVAIPEGAEERAHGVAMAAFAERRPSPRERNLWRPAVVVVAVAALAGVLASPPGRSVIQSIREAVGVKKTQHELFSLPAPGRILVDSSGGPWVVDANGSRRRLGSYREASWSPFGRFVVAARANELVTLDPMGGVHWTLGRPAVRFPRWGGLHANTRIAYVDRTGLRVVAGDGTGDRLLAPAETGPFAWRPGVLSQLAYVSASEVRLEDVDSGRVLWRANRGLNEPVRRIAWSADGTRLLVVTAHGLRVYDSHGRVVSRDDTSSAAANVDATFVGQTHEVAVLRNGTDVFLLRTRLTLFRAGGLRRVVSSPDGRWLLLSWPAADQWVFVGVQAPHRIRAFSGITRQFGGGAFPTVSGWIGK
jgi:hypothetical protein